MSHFLTLVDVLADLHRAWSETVGALALEPAFHVGTRSVATDVVDSALVVVYIHQHRQRIVNNQRGSMVLRETYRHIYDRSRREQIPLGTRSGRIRPC